MNIHQSLQDRRARFISVVRIDIGLALASLTSVTNGAYTDSELRLFTFDFISQNCVAHWRIHDWKPRWFYRESRANPQQGPWWAERIMGRSCSGNENLWQVEQFCLYCSQDGFQSSTRVKFPQTKMRLAQFVLRWIRCCCCLAITASDTCSLRRRSLISSDANKTNNKWSKIFDDRSRRRRDFSLGQFNVTLDWFCERSTGMLVHSKPGNHSAAVRLIRILFLTVKYV